MFKKTYRTLFNITIGLFLETESYIGSFTLEVPNKVEEIYSDTFYTEQVPWRISVIQTSENRESVDLELHCDYDNWYRYEVAYSMELYSEVKEGYVSFSSSREIFSSGGNAIYGGALFWSDLNDKKKGFLDDDGMITVRVAVKIVKKIRRTSPHEK